MTLFMPVKVRTSENPFLADVFAVEGTCILIFKFVASTVWAVRQGVVFPLITPFLSLTVEILQNPVSADVYEEGGTY